MREPTISEMRKAAEMRLLRAGWHDVAAELELTEAELRVWPTLFPERWRRALKKAERGVFLSAGLEALVTLRRLLRSDDEKMRRDAAESLAGLRLKLLARPSNPAHPAADPSLEQLDDSELDRLLAGQSPDVAEGEA